MDNLRNSFLRYNFSQKFSCLVSQRVCLWCATICVCLTVPFNVTGEKVGYSHVNKARRGGEYSWKGWGSSSGGGGGVTYVVGKTFSPNVRTINFNYFILILFKIAPTIVSRNAQVCPSAFFSCKKYFYMLE